MKSDRHLFLYHAGCWDGFCAAWVHHCHPLPADWPPISYIPVQYGEDPPYVKGAIVTIADFCYPRPVLGTMIADAAKLIVLDHHPTAMECDGMKGVTITIGKSGARLMCEALGMTPHWLVDYTEDRDLWRHALPHSREVNAALRSYPLDFETWDYLAKMEPGNLIDFGAAILRSEEALVRQHVTKAVTTVIAGHAVRMVNATVLMSEIGHALAQDHPFGATYLINAKGQAVVSLRSREEGLDVSKIARQFGGGGHQHAAGFAIDYPGGILKIP